MECKEIREGVKLAVQMSSLLQRIASQAQGSVHAA
jgi:hypothetical protein